MAENFWEEGVPCYTVATRRELQALLAQRGAPDLILFCLPENGDISIYEIEQLRITDDIPLLCLVSESPTRPEQSALLQVADDFALAPYSDAELMLRASRLVRRPRNRQRSAPAEADIRVDFENRTISDNYGETALSPVEIQLLELLNEHWGRTVTFEELVTLIDGPNFENRLNALRVHIRRLRKKLEPNPNRPVYIMTARGVGYRLNSKLQTVTAYSSVEQNGQIASDRQDDALYLPQNGVPGKSR
ncbi:MAG: response regulator transcription factor [Caldilineaceae bacterium]|nr:response regulator transcription factor [Caldilineaceae bacterium]